MSRPNISWISLQDTSPRFGCYGDAVARTPNLDKLSAQGRDFLESAAPHRDYVFAHRDRHDESYDMVRAARDERFKYLRHFCPPKKAKRPKPKRSSSGGAAACIRKPPRRNFRSYAPPVNRARVLSRAVAIFNANLY